MPSPSFPNQEIIHDAAGVKGRGRGRGRGGGSQHSRTLNQGLDSDRGSINGLLNSAKLDNQEVDSAIRGGGPTGPGEIGAGDRTDNSFDPRQMNGETLSDSVEHHGHQGIRITNMDTGQDQSLISDNKMQDHVNSHSRTINTNSRGRDRGENPPRALGRAHSSLGHFHGPHFGMIDHSSLPKRPPS